jgi:hypothetical protein
MNSSLTPETKLGRYEIRSLSSKDVRRLLSQELAKTKVENLCDARGSFFSEHNWRSTKSHEITRTGN